MSYRKVLTDRLLAMFGLDFEFSLDMQRKPFSEITENLFVGSRPRRDDIVALKDIGITHVVSCLPEREQSNLSYLSRDFECLFVPVCDSINEDIACAFPSVFEFAAKASEKDAGAKLLVHCEAGVSRSATVAIALVMHSQSKTFFDAFLKVRQGRPEALPNIGFASQLQQLENALIPGQITTREPSSLARYLSQICNAPVEPELLQRALERHDYDAGLALRAVFGDDIPRVVQGVKL